MKRKKLLITGSAGFIMGNFVRRLLFLMKKDPEQYNYVISSIDRVSSGNLGDIYSNRSHNFHIADITDKHILDVIFKLERPDIVIHGASITDNSMSMDTLLATNVTGTQNVINMCDKYNVERMYTLEDHESVENNVGSTQKMSSDLVKLSGINYSKIKMPRVFGPRQGCSQITPASIYNVNNNIPIKAVSTHYGWAHVFDVCSAINYAIKYDIQHNSSDPHYGIMDMSKLSEYEMAKKINEALGGKVKVSAYYEATALSHHDLTSSDSYEDRFSFWENNCFNMNRIGWKPEKESNINDSLNETINWYLKNKWFFKNLSKPSDIV